MAEYHVSASQINTWELCARKWGHDKLDKVPRRPSKAAHKGTMTHKQLEDWLQFKQLPLFNGTEDERHAAVLAQAIIQHLPPPQTPGMVVEGRTSIYIEGIKFVLVLDVGRYDLPVPWVSDHKTTSDFCWALTEETIIDDAQACLYGYYGMARAQKPEVDLQWTYARTRGAAVSMPIRKRVTLPMIQPRMDKSLATAREILAVRAEPGLTAMDLPYDAAGCAAYGGCQYVELCNLTPRERMRSIMNQEATKTNFMDKLKARQAAQADATTHPPPAAPTPSAPVNPPTTPSAPAAPVPTPAPAVPPPVPAAPKAAKATKTPKKPKTPTPKAPAVVDAVSGA